MPKSINIHSLLQAKASLTEPSFIRFLKFYDIEVRDAEIKDLESLVKTLAAVKCGIGALDKFFLGYKIPQIGKEFDLLRFGNKSILNIELKSSCDQDKIKKQLLRNKYYLSFLGRNIYAFTYVSDSQELFYLKDDGSLIKASIDGLVALLIKEKADESVIPDNLFDPSYYLVSPFNSTKRFLDGAYFLTNQQEDIEKKVDDFIGAAKGAAFVSIVGGAGTGKTLLTYDIARKVIEAAKTPLIIHCGLLNFGHHNLIEEGWNIIPIKSYKKEDLAKYDLIIVDEAQRIYESQLKSIIETVNDSKLNCIFSHDKLQTLASWEENVGASATISAIKGIAEHKLSEKIRTNKEIGSFVKMLFSNKRTESISKSGNIEVNFFNSDEDAKKYLDSLNSDKWEVLRFTPSQYYKEHHEKYFESSKRTSHEVIGQEFDGVAVTIDRFFGYDENGNLVYKGKTYYDSTKMLFQNITRSRKRLNVILIGNEELMNRCISLLQ